MHPGNTNKYLSVILLHPRLARSKILTMGVVPQPIVFHAMGIPEKKPRQGENVPCGKDLKRAMLHDGAGLRGERKTRGQKK